MESFPLARISTRKKWRLCLLLMVVPSLVLGFVVGVLARAPAEAVKIVGLLWVTIVAAFLLFDRSAHVRFEVGEGRLRIRGDWFGRALSLATLDLGKTVILDLEKAEAFRPKWRICGTGLPGYSAGSFSMRNGREALVFLSDQTRVLGVPMADGRLLLLSCEEPSRLLEALLREKAAYPADERTRKVEKN